MSVLTLVGQGRGSFGSITVCIVGAHAADIGAERRSAPEAPPCMRAAHEFGAEETSVAGVVAAPIAQWFWQLLWLFAGALWSIHATDPCCKRLLA